MKTFALVIVALIVVYAEASKEMLMKTVNDCMETVGAGQPDIARFIGHQRPETSTQKCLLNCVMTNMSVLNDGKLDKEGFMDLANKISKGTKMDMATKAFETCSKLSDPDPCESAVAIAMCLKKEGEGILPF